MAQGNGSGPRRIAVVNDLAGLHRAIREWVAELNVSRATIDHVGGLPDGHASKLLAPAPLKHFGHVSLGLMLGACGLDLWVMVNHDKLRQLQGEGRLPRRQTKRWMQSQALHEVWFTKKVARGDLVDWGRRGGETRRAMPKAKLEKLMRQTARARWRRQNNKPT